MLRTRDSCTATSVSRILLFVPCRSLLRSDAHIMNLSGVGPKKGCAFLLTGVHRIADLPAQQKLNVTQQRQIRAMRENRLIVEPGLQHALEAFHGRIGFLDFETIQRAVPVWPGMGPWEQGTGAVQLSRAAGRRHVCARRVSGGASAGLPARAGAPYDRGDAARRHDRDIFPFRADQDSGTITPTSSAASALNTSCTR